MKQNQQAHKTTAHQQTLLDNTIVHSVPVKEDQGQTDIMVMKADFIQDY